MQNDKNHILSFIREMAADNGGVPPGQRKFGRATGISSSAWRGTHWSSWSQALQEAGFPPNKPSARISDQTVLKRLVEVIGELGRFPTSAELQLRSKQDPSFPSRGVIARLGRQPKLLSKLIDYCQLNTGHDDVERACVSLLHARKRYGRPKPLPTCVYLIQVGHDYKIGWTANLERRMRDMATYVAEKPSLIHTIPTDDPLGVEVYWHNRFANKWIRGEWFALTSEDVRTFRRWKTM